MKLAGKNILVTGASRGFGKAAARTFLSEGANVAICARNRKKLEEAKKELVSAAKNKAKIFAFPTDVSDKSEMSNFVDLTVSELGSIDVLLSNAGILGPVGSVDELEFSNWTRTVEVNLYGTVIVCSAVIPHMKEMGGGKIIIMSGGGATKPMPFLSAYAASKAAVVRFSETLAQEVEGFNISVNAVAPGALNTDMIDEVIKAGPEKVGAEYFEQMQKVKEGGGAPLEAGAELCVFLASDESDGITGKLISAVWDPWPEFPQRIDDLKGTDIFTLRRIIPKERGKDWG